VSAGHRRGNLVREAIWWVCFVFFAAKALWWLAAIVFMLGDLPAGHGWHGQLLWYCFGKFVTPWLIATLFWENRRLERQRHAVRVVINHWQEARSA